MRDRGTESGTCSEDGRLAAADTTSSGDDSDAGGADDFFGSSPESEPKSDVHTWKQKLAPEPSGDDDNVTASSRSRDAKPDTDDDSYSYASESEPENDEPSDASSESASGGSSSSSSDVSSDDGEETEEGEATAERSSKTSSASASAETKFPEKQTKKQNVQKVRKELNVSLLDLYPKSLSLVGLSSRKDQEKEETSPARPKSSASARPSLQTRVLRRSESLEDFTASLPERFKRKGCDMDNTELMRLNKAVYEAWYFHKEEQIEKLKREAKEMELQEKTMKPRKLFQKTVPRKTKRLKMSERVKMKIDQKDPEWEWLQKKLIKMKKAKLKSKVKAKEEQESREKEKASKLEDGALAYAAWKTKKDEMIRQKRREDKAQAREKAQAEIEDAEENRMSADKVFEQYKERVAAEEREEELRRRQRQRRLADRTAQLLEVRDRQAQARYHQWLQGAIERAVESPDSAGRHTPPPPRPPWYPGGTLGGGRPPAESTPPRPERPSTASRQGGVRGWRPCHQAHCPACPCSPAAAAVSSTSRPDVLLTVDQPVNCASRRAVYVVRCLFCGLQYVGWTLQSVRAAFARQLRALQEEAGSSLAEHVTEHRRQSGRFVPLTECLLLTGVRAFPQTASRHAVADFAHVAKEILGTVSPDGINRH